MATRLTCAVLCLHLFMLVVNSVLGDRMDTAESNEGAIRDLLLKRALQTRSVFRSQRRFATLLCTPRLPACLAGRQIERIPCPGQTGEPNCRCHCPTRLDQIRLNLGNRQTRRWLNKK
ncbi:hypothetical protein CAPTEDRAFT_185778 [Capitella teleta]|uniref:Uncharacterized protein n=1 Tax=Capitella teleta TaxID=283909 RepID=R7VLI4_CAPTE|nr:hypothetical protein CAPTEDRAFT_185778 [Capitella teleta]|eukprot:ELU18296.1 hypothetical protein CAPTEDRAFT_185778 [Capitella teleta]